MSSISQSIQHLLTFIKSNLLFEAHIETQTEAPAPAHVPAPTPAPTHAPTQASTQAPTYPSTYLPKHLPTQALPTEAPWIETHTQREELGNMTSSQPFQQAVLLALLAVCHEVDREAG